MAGGTIALLRKSDSCSDARDAIRRSSSLIDCFKTKLTALGCACFATQLCMKEAIPSRATPVSERALLEPCREAAATAASLKRRLACFARKARARRGNEYADEMLQSYL
eukprot:6177228-Pleurochrysis_carterae.AAC.1